MSRTLSLGDKEYMVISFTPRKTKRGDKMANVVLADEDKDLYSVVVFPTAYAESLVRMKPGGVCKPILNTTSSGSTTVKGFERV